MTTQEQKSDSEMIAVHPQQGAVNRFFGCVGMMIAFALNVFTYISAFFLIASAFEFSRDVGIMVCILVIVSKIIVWRVHQLIKNLGITITLNSEKHALDNIYPVYLLLILFIGIQAVCWVADPSSETYEPRTYFMTLVSAALIYFSNGYRRLSRPVTDVDNQ